MITKRILVVEDEKVWSKLLRDILEEQGHHVEVVESADDAIREVRDVLPHLVISDINLGGFSGTQLCQWLRSDPTTAQIPIMILTVLHSEDDKVKGFGAGADDYLTKPFGRRELVARVEALLRRAGSEKMTSSQIKARDLVLDLESHEVKIKGQSIELRPKEFALLTVLMQKKGRVVRKEALIESAWSGADVIVTSQALAQHVKNLRAKLGSCSNYIETVETLGYKLRYQ